MPIAPIGTRTTSVTKKWTVSSGPNPSQLWVFNDEHPDSINDGWEIINPTDLNNWTDWHLPASYHNGACGFGLPMATRILNVGWNEHESANPGQQSI